MMPGAMVLTRMPNCARSRAAGTVMPCTPPLEAEYAIWPIWPSNAATEAVLMTTPRWPDSSTVSVLAIASAARRITLKVPSRLTVMTVRNSSRSCGPFLDRMRPAQPTPAQLTTMRSGTPESTIWSIAAWTSSPLVTSVGMRVTPAGTLSPARSMDWARSSPKTVAPASAKRLAVAAPRPEAAPVTSAAVPWISTVRSSFLAATVGRPVVT